MKSKNEFRREMNVLKWSDKTKLIEMQPIIE